MLVKMSLLLGAALILCTVSEHQGHCKFISLLCCLVVKGTPSFTAAQPSAIWNGHPVDQPILIYHDEIQVSNSGIATGGLVCSSSSGAGWHYPNATLVPLSSPNTFYQLRSSSQTMSILVRSREESVESPDFNGLWTCRQDRNFATAVPVGLYRRGMGEWIKY